jgi:hypothetical protein
MLKRIKIDDRSYYRGEHRGHTFFVEQRPYRAPGRRKRAWFARCSSLELETPPCVTRDVAVEAIIARIERQEDVGAPLVPPRC